MTWPNRRTFSFWISAFAILSLLACGGGGGGGGSSTPSVTVSVTPPSATVTVSTTKQFTAVVANASTQAVTWSVQEGNAGGSIDSSGLYTAPATPGTYHVAATSVAAASASMTATVTVVPAPTITSFTAGKSNLSVGSGTALTATFSGGTGSVDQGIGTVTTGLPASTGNLSATTTYHLTVTNAAGSTVTSQLTITVVPLPVITGFSATPAVIGSGGTSTLAGTFSGGTGMVDQGVGALASGAGISTGTLHATTVFTLTVTNAAGDHVSAQATVTVVTAPPTISAFTATPTTITLGHSSTLAWTVSGQAVSSLTIDQGIGDVTGLASATTQVSPSTATTYTLTATNPMGSVQAVASVNVVFAPSITSFKAAPTTVTPNSASTLTAIFSQGAGVITPGIGPITSGIGISTGTLTTGTTYTLTVTNAAHDSITQQLTVHVDPGTFTPAGNAMSVSRVRHTCTLLPNGKVLMAGGSDTSTLADEFDPAASAGLGGFSVSVNGMASIRDSASAVLLASGNVLVLGGFNPSLTLPRQLASADLYDPAARTFTPSASHMGTARQQFTATLLLNGKVLIAGGYLDSGNTLGTAELYDPVTDTFHASASALGTPRWGHLATLLPNGKVLIVGGSSGGAAAPGAELYDPQLDTFVPTGGANLAAYWNTMTLLPSGKVLIALTGSSVASTSLLYDPATGLATATAGAPDAGRVQAPTATLMGDGRVLLAGNLGLPGMDAAGDCELFNLATGLYNYTANPGDRWEHCASQLQDGRVLLVGGYDSGTHQYLATGTLFTAGPAVASPAPSASITTPPTATTGAMGLMASVPITTGAAYHWTVSNGTITSPLGLPSITFTAGATGNLRVDCLVVSPYGIPSHGSATVTITP